MQSVQKICCLYYHSIQVQYQYYYWTVINRIFIMKIICCLLYICLWYHNYDLPPCVTPFLPQYDLDNLFHFFLDQYYHETILGCLYFLFMKRNDPILYSHFQYHHNYCPPCVTPFQIQYDHEPLFYCVNYFWTHDDHDTLSVWVKTFWPQYYCETFRHCLYFNEIMMLYFHLFLQFH